MSRRESYVVAFSEDDSSHPPRVILKAEDAVASDIQNVTPDNIVAYATQQKNLLSEKTLTEQVKPMVLGNNAWARHVVEATYKGSSAIEIQILTTVVSGRVYTLRLEVYEGDIPKYRDLAYAIAATLEFTGRSAPVADPAPSEEPPTEPAAEDDDADDAAEEPAGE